MSDRIRIATIDDAPVLHRLLQAAYEPLREMNIRERGLTLRSAVSAPSRPAIKR
ncbi:hypothetical protein [Rhizobium azibense]|uniref:Uncharacterized protein n=1 Tax=Rhizobium azibense TaxID=1136135 RepID=A0A4R3RG33_9HYPH|nr:hypothetical protein [Rhizobium azibense]TCU33574.1 hypothetical protein EV129_11579 [Rhizobium azibense]